MDLGRVSWRGISPRSDSPDRFISDHGLVQFPGFHIGQAAAQLPRENFLDASSFALLERFADTDNGAQYLLVRRADLAIYHLIRFAEEGTPFAVAEHDVADK